MTIRLAEQTDIISNALIAIRLFVLVIIMFLPISQAICANVTAPTQHSGSELTRVAPTSDVTKNAPALLQKTNWSKAFLSTITSPDVAYILLLIGVYGLLFESFNPGMILPGVVGAICLLLALYAFQLLPVNYTGFALLILGIVFMIIDVIISSFGIIGIGGIIAFVLGSIFLFDSNQPQFTISWQLIALMFLVSAGFFLTIINLAIRSRRKKTVTGIDAFIGKTGDVSSMVPDGYYVKIDGELWKAESSQELIIGEKIQVVNLSGLLLTVEPVIKKTLDNSNLK